MRLNHIRQLHDSRTPIGQINKLCLMNNCSINLGRDNRVVSLNLFDYRMFPKISDIEKRLFQLRNDWEGFYFQFKRNKGGDVNSNNINIVT